MGRRTYPEVQEEHEVPHEPQLQLKLTGWSQRGDLDMSNHAWRHSWADDRRAAGGVSE